MPCLGLRKKSVQKTSFHDSGLESISSEQTAVQMEQDYEELKTKNKKHAELIAQQNLILEQLRSQLTLVQVPSETKDDEFSEMLADKDNLLKASELELAELKETLRVLQKDNPAAQMLAEKDQLLREKGEELERIQQQWENERAELVKPALAQVNIKLEKLKETNQVFVERLNEKEEELAELRAQFNRMDRKPKAGTTKDQEHQKKLNRITTDLENDRLLMQRLDELNQQLELQKKEHEAVLEKHEKMMAEKDKKLEGLKKSHREAIDRLERAKMENINRLQLKYDLDIKRLDERLEQADIEAKNTANNEVEKILQEFEQYKYDHSVEVAHVYQDHQEKISVMKQGQQSELQQWSTPSTIVPRLRRTGGPVGKIQWPVPELSVAVELSPKNKQEIHVYTSSISANPLLKEQEKDIANILGRYQLPFQRIDVAKSDLALQYMRKINTRSRTLPQIFLGGDYRCTYEELIKAEQDGTLFEFLNQ